MRNIIYITVNGANLRDTFEKFTKENCHSKFTTTNEVMSDTFGMCEIYTNDREWAVVIVAIGCQHGTMFIDDIVNNNNNISKYDAFQALTFEQVIKIAKKHNLRNSK